MAEIPKGLPEQNQENLRLRLVRAVKNTDIQRRKIRDVQPNFLPPSKLQLHSTGSSEMFVLLVENLQRYKIVKERSAADRILANALLAADYLTDALPGNDEAVMFVHRAKSFLDKENPQLSSDVKKVMEAAEKRGIKRQDLYGRWKANQ